MTDYEPGMAEALEHDERTGMRAEDVKPGGRYRVTRYLHGDLGGRIVTVDKVYESGRAKVWVEDDDTVCGIPVELLTPVEPEPAPPTAGEVDLSNPWLRCICGDLQRHHDEGGCGGCPCRSFRPPEPTEPAPYLPRKGERVKAGVEFTAASDFTPAPGGFPLVIGTYQHGDRVIGVSFPPGTTFERLPDPGPVWRTNDIVRDDDGRVFRRRLHTITDLPWQDFLGEKHPEDYPTRPLTRLVPEGEK